MKVVKRKLQNKVYGPKKGSQCSDTNDFKRREQIRRGRILNWCGFVFDPKYPPHNRRTKNNREKAVEQAPHTNTHHAIDRGKMAERTWAMDDERPLIKGSRMV